jgi:hypothetical protein
MTYDDWKSTDATPEPDPNRCEKCGHPEGNCDCRCCNEPPLMCDRCGCDIFGMAIWDEPSMFCSEKCRDNEAEDRGMSRAASDLR